MSNVPENGIYTRRLAIWLGFVALTYLFSWACFTNIDFWDPNPNTKRVEIKDNSTNQLSDYQKCRLDYIGKRGLNVGRMSDHQRFKMEAGISAAAPHGCGGLSQQRNFNNALKNNFESY